MYALSHGGRQRWGEFPLVHSDDKFARLHFKKAERHLVLEAQSLIELPSDLPSLFRTRLRWCRGNRELSKRFPELQASDQARYRGIGTILMRRPNLWLALMPCLLLHGSALLVARLFPRHEYAWKN